MVNTLITKKAKNNSPILHEARFFIFTLEMLYLIHYINVSAVEVLVNTGTGFNVAGSLTNP
jgi:hypothetical protein